MKVSFYLNYKEIQRDVLSAFAVGVKAHGHIIDMREARDNLETSSDLHVVMGFQDGTEEIIKQCRANGLDYIFLDHAYFNRGYDKGNFRVVLNGLAHNDWKPRRTDRLRKLNLKVNDWRMGGNNVVMITNAMQPEDRREIFGAVGWIEEAVCEIQKHSKMDMLIKNKWSHTQLFDYLSCAKCLVTHSSLASIEAVLYGVPVFVHESNPASPVGQTNLAKINQPIYPDRESWLACLSYGQFTIDELKSGLAFGVVFGEGKEHGD